MAALAAIAMAAFYCVFGYLPLVAWIGAPVIVIFLVINMVRGQNTQPCIVLNDDGVLDTRLKVGVIRWSDIRRISCHSVESVEYISLDLRNSATYEARRPLWFRVASQVQRVHGMSSIAISTNGLDIARDTLVNMLHQGCDNASHRNPGPA
jgi:hypothetical protein